MEDVIRLYDDEDLEEIKATRENAEDVFTGFKKKNTTMGDVILIQCILCILAIIALAVLNIFKPVMTNDILYQFKQHLDKPFEYKDEISEMITKIIGSFNAKL